MKSIEWLGNTVRFLDQTELLLNEVYIETSEKFIKMSDILLIDTTNFVNV